MKELDAELLLELPDLLAERRLADMKPLRGLSEVQAVCHGNGVAEMTEFHSPSYAKRLNRNETYISLAQ